MEDVNVIPLFEGTPALHEFVEPSELSVHAQRLIDYAERKGGRLPKGMTKQTIVQKFNQVFEMIGGVPRFALWADQNPDAFYMHYAKLLPAQARLDLIVKEDAAPDQLSLKELHKRVVMELQVRERGEEGAESASG